MSPDRVFTVSEINQQIKYILESSLPALWVEGEISDFTWHASGHMYFTLKDNYAQLRCVMWKTHNQHLFFTPAEGLKVQVQGKITLYERGGIYQLTAYQMHPVGVGDLRLAFRRLADQLRAEGLFDQKHKKPLPRFATRIGVVTSPTGAAIQDISRVIGRRFPPARILLRPVAVQGPGAARQISRAIEELNRQDEVQVIIVGRGGGPPEDLWAFNEEVVARAIFHSHIPVVSAVGHEIDLTISDLVADLRAPTPSAAGELVVPDGREVLALLESLQGRMGRATRALLAERWHVLNRLKDSHGMRRPADMMARRRHDLRTVGWRLSGNWAHVHLLAQSELRAWTEKLTALDPDAVLDRGYSVCRRLRDMVIVSNARQLHLNEAVEVTFARGSVEASVRQIRPQRLKKTQGRRSVV